MALEHKWLRAKLMMKMMVKMRKKVIKTMMSWNCCMVLRMVMLRVMVM